MGRILICNTDLRDPDHGCTVWDDGDTTGRDNGWDGFETAGTRRHDPEGWRYLCDGMPRPMGCGAEIHLSRPWMTVGRKPSGWVVTYGAADPDDRNRWDLDVVLVFCPACVADQEARWGPFTFPPRGVRPETMDAVPAPHEHEWIDATLHSTRASTLVECAVIGCPEIGYRLAD